MDNLSLLIRKKYGSIDAFANEVLGMDYRTFNRRQVMKNFRYLEIKQILAALEIKFEDLIELPGKKASEKIQSAPRKKKAIVEEPIVVGGQLGNEGTLGQRLRAAKK